MADAPLPKEQLLLKLLKMTTADNDGECLVAIRKANELLRSAGWDWDKLIAGKIKVVENPFSKIGTPPTGPGVAARPPQQASTPTAAPAQARPTPPQPSYSAGTGRRWRFNSAIWDWETAPDPNYRAPTAPPPRSAFKGLGLSKTNMYANHCWCCGDYVANNAGFIMKPTDFNKSAVVPNRSGWAVVCNSCDAARTPDSYGVPTRAAPKVTGQTTVQGPAPSLNNL